MKEIYKRLKAETPVFFKRLRNFGLSLTATATSIVAINGIPSSLKNYASTAIWVGLVIAAIAQLPVNDPEKLKNS